MQNQITQTSANVVHPMVTAFLACLAQAQAVEVDSPLLSSWGTELPNGEEDNEVAIFQWVEDEDNIYSVKLTEGGIAKGKFKDDAFVCEDHEGEQVEVKFYKLTPIFVNPLTTFDGFAAELTRLLKEKGTGYALVDKSSDSFFILGGEEVYCMERANGDDLLAPQAIYTDAYASCISPIAWTDDCWTCSTPELTQETVLAPVFVRIKYVHDVAALTKHIEESISLMRSATLDPVSISISEKIDIELHPGVDDRVVVGRLNWGHTNVNYTSEGVIVDVYPHAGLDSVHTASVYAEELQDSDE